MPTLIEHVALVEPRRFPDVRREDIYFEDGFMNLVARVVVLAVNDAKRIGKGQRKLYGDLTLTPAKAQNDLECWMYSGRFEDWARFIGIDPDALEETICNLLESA